MVAAVRDWRALRFITLTLKADGASLADRFARLFRCFQELRKRQVWKDNVVAAIAVPEVTIGRGGQWHTHLHVLCDGSFIPQPQLKKAWHDVTGDSYIVGIEAVHDRGDAAAYVAQYVAAGNEVWKWQPERIREYAEATHGMRMVRVFGKAKMPALDDDNEPDVTGESGHLVDVHALLRAEDAGREVVRHAVDILARLGRAHALVLDREPPPRAAKGQPRLDATPSAHDMLFARRVCELLQRDQFSVPGEEELERLRRQSYNEPEPPRPAKFVQAVMDVLWDRARI